MRTPATLTAVLLAVLLFQPLSLNAQPAPDAASPFVVTEQLVCEIDAKRFEKEVFLVSPDGLRLAYGTKNGRKISVVVDGKQGKEYDSIGKPVWSPDSRRLAYLAVKGNRQFVCLDGAEGKPYDEVSLATLAWSPDGARFAYAAKSWGKFHLNVDGAEEKTGYEFIDTPVWSPDGRRIAYLARSGNENTGKSLVVVDGRPGDLHRAAGQPVWSPDSLQVAYTASDSWTRVVLDGKEGKGYAAVKSSLHFLPGSGRLAYLAETYKSMLLVVDGKEGPEYDPIKLPGLLYSADGARSAYTALRGKSYYMVVDGKEEGPYDEIGYPKVSPGGKKIAYAAKKDGEYFVVVNGKRGAGYQAMAHGNLFFSPAGDRLIYFALKDKKYAAVIDGRDGAPYDNAGSPAWSPDGRQVVYAAQAAGQQFLVLEDGREGPRCDGFAAGMTVWGPDGRHLAAAAQAKGQWCVTVDGQATNWYSTIVSAPVFESPTDLRFMCVSGTKVFITRVKIK